MNDAGNLVDQKWTQVFSETNVQTLERIMLRPLFTWVSIIKMMITLTKEFS